jgi:ribosomal-protein-serine acetyltransferase
LFNLIQANRKHLRRWHPWTDVVRSVADTERAITTWQQQHDGQRGFYAGIWFREKLCGVINHLGIDPLNRWTALSFWLDEAQQGQGIMTASCRAFVAHTFDVMKLNRVTIECATENSRSRAIPERLGFRFEGVVREIEWLHDRYVDHAIYGLLRSDYGRNHSIAAQEFLAVASR